MIRPVVAAPAPAVPVLAILAFAALASGLPAAPAAAQGAVATQVEDCAFLERSFQEVYDGLRRQRELRGARSQPPGAQDPALVAMFVGIQQNIILMHTARGCDPARLIDLARTEAAKYGTQR
ncbi:hypothetical protein [Arenibaculum pallidiluteum]|uniref:hypothetical protein n=1 Tax=Arenibaculum pallidiluteum TaxID=2812559 RepID=UPI001A973299|nr:hypothetical protein [Arenibaculum pallidiluteum]